MKRLFIGIKIAVDSAIEIERFVEQKLKPLFLQECRVKWVPRENYHITLAFLGNCPEAIIPQLRTLLSEVATPYEATELTVDSLGLFPSMRKPKTLFLQAYELKYFKPHITLARIGSEF